MFDIVPTPEKLAATPIGALDAPLAAYLKPPEDAGRKPVDYVLAIPPDFGAQPGVRLWTNARRAAPSWA